MNAYVGRDEIAVQRSDSLSHYFKDEPGYMPQPEAEQPHFFARLGKFLHWLAEMPQRRAVIDELTSLSDHELADIGLTRCDLPRVFDDEFAAERNGRHQGRSGSSIRPIPL